MLALDQVVFTYGGGTSALREVTLTLPAGELVTVIGPNGSGKSTLLKLLARIMRPTQGTVTLDGVDVEQIPVRTYARRVGYLAQENDAAFPIRAIDAVMTGRAPYLGRFQWESAADAAAAERALGTCDALHLADRLLHEMSGGERKRVFLARVLVAEPEIVLLDEPLASLDVAHVESLARLMRRLVDDDGRSVVFVSHDFNWAAAFSDRVIVMSEGRIVASGRPTEVLTPEVMNEVFGMSAEIITGSGGVGWIVPRLQRS